MGHRQVLGLGGAVRRTNELQKTRPEDYAQIRLQRAGYFAPAPAGPGP